METPLEMNRRTRRRFLAPHLRDQPDRRLLGSCRAVPALAGHHARDQQPRPGPGDRGVLAVLAVVGIEALRRQTAQEFPPGPARSGPDRRGGGRRETRAPPARWSLASAPRWHGRCPACGAWNTLVEERLPGRVTARPRGGDGRGPRATGAAARGQRRARPVPEDEIGELDRVLGGGVARPARRVARDRKVHADEAWLSATSPPPGGARSTSPVRSRPRRSACAPSGSARRRSTCPSWPRPTSAPSWRRSRPSGRRVRGGLGADAAGAALESAPGTVGQVREVATRITEVAKRRTTAVVVVGHVCATIVAQ